MVVIPTKPFNKAKSRLAAVLGPEERQALSKKLFLHVLHTSRIPRVKGQLVITRDKHIKNLAEKEGAATLLEEEEGLNNALKQATKWLIKKGAPYILILPTDLPFLKPGNVAKILDLAEEERTMVISSSHRGGTNALLVKPPGIIEEYAYGKKSFQTVLYYQNIIPVGIHKIILIKLTTSITVPTTNQCNPQISLISGSDILSSDSCLLSSFVSRFPFHLSRNKIKTISKPFLFLFEIVIKSFRNNFKTIIKRIVL